MGKRRRQQTARCGARGKPSALSPLPSDLIAAVARAALTAEGSTVRARRRLSLVCRAWRECLRGAQSTAARHLVSSSKIEAHPRAQCKAQMIVLVTQRAARCYELRRTSAAAPIAGYFQPAGVPLHVVFRTQLPPERLQAALSSVPVASVRLPESAAPLPPHAVSAVMSALARSAATLTALRGLPLPDGPAFDQLAAFLQLRVVTLRVTSDSPEVLQASQLPPSLERMTIQAPQGYSSGANAGLPWFSGCEQLRKLRRITFAGYGVWRLGSWDPATEQPCPLHLPPGFKVRPA